MFFGCKERHEDLIHNIRFDARSIIFKIYYYPIIIVHSGQNTDLSSFFPFNSIHGIQDQINNHLVDKVRVGSDHEVGWKYFIGAANRQLIHLGFQQALRTFKNF